MSQIDAVVTRVIEYWPINGSWMVEVEVMADGQYLPRVGRLRTYGNAINIEAATAFIKSYMAAVDYA